MGNMSLLLFFKVARGVYVYIHIYTYMLIYKLIELPLTFVYNWFD
jgi:hypothetical protein